MHACMGRWPAPCAAAAGKRYPRSAPTFGQHILCLHWLALLHHLKRRLDEPLKRLCHGICCLVIAQLLLAARAIHLAATGSRRRRRRRRLPAAARLPLRHQYGCGADASRGLPGGGGRLGSARGCEQWRAQQHGRRVDAPPSCGCSRRIQQTSGAAQLRQGAPQQARPRQRHAHWAWGCDQCLI